TSSIIRPTCRPASSGCAIDGASSGWNARGRRRRAGSPSPSWRRRPSGRVSRMTAEPDRGLQRQVRSFRHDPFGFVRFAFPWGKAGTELKDETGPETWQRELLQQLGLGLASPEEATRIAVASGHGIGKSALVAWIVLWAMSTCPDTRGIVTANTEQQLRTKTWPELAKWHRLAANRDWFVDGAAGFHSARRGQEGPRRGGAVPSSAKHTD